VETFSETFYGVRFCPSPYRSIIMDSSLSQPFVDGVAETGFVSGGSPEKVFLKKEEE